MQMKRVFHWFIWRLTYQSRRRALPDTIYSSAWNAFPLEADSDGAPASRSLDACRYIIRWAVRKRLFSQVSNLYFGIFALPVLWSSFPMGGYAAEDNRLAARLVFVLIEKMVWMYVCILLDSSYWYRFFLTEKAGEFLVDIESLYIRGKIYYLIFLN